MDEKIPVSVRAARYVAGIEAGDIQVPVFVEAAASKWKDLHNTEGVIYKPTKVDRLGRMIEAMPCPEGVITHFHLWDWQCFLLSWLCGFVDKDTGARTINEALIVVPRKAGKSSLLAAFCLATMAEPVGGVVAPKVLMLGINDDTARMTFDKATGIINADKARKTKGTRFSKHFGYRALTNEIRCGKSGAEIETLTFGARSLEGYTPEMVIIDEISRLPNTQGIEVFRSGFGAAFSPQLLMTTTPSDLPYSAYDVELQRGLRWLGKKPDGSDSDGGRFDDHHYCALVYAAGTDDDAGDEKVWQRTQPSYFDVAGMQRQYSNGWKAAQLDEFAMHAFKTRQLCMPARLSGSWIDVDDWKATPDPEPEPLREAGWLTYIGIDLSDVRDLTGICVLQINEDEERQRVWFYCHVPRGGLPQNAEDKTATATPDIVKWIDDGWVEVHESETINHEVIANRLDKLTDDLRPVLITSDQYNAINDVKRFAKTHTRARIRGYTKSLAKFTSPIATLTGWVRDRTIEVQKNPVAERHLRNAVMEQGRDGGYILRKATKTSTEKIDLMDALLTAIGGYLLSYDEKLAGTDEAPIIGEPLQPKPRVVG